MKNNLISASFFKKIYIVINFSCLMLPVIFLFSGCIKQKEEVIVFDSTYPLALSPNVEWALITDPYVAYKSDKEWASETIGHCRRGEILQVKGKSVDSENIIWYRFDNGWLCSSCLSIYNNRYKAQTAAEQIQQKD